MDMLIVLANIYLNSIVWTSCNGSLDCSKLLYCLEITEKYSVQHWFQSEKWLSIAIIQSL